MAEQWRTERREVMERLARVESQAQAANDWKEQRSLVLAKLNRFEEISDQIFTKLNKLYVDVSVMKVKSGYWGAIGAFIPLALAAVFAYFFSSGTR